MMTTTEETLKETFTLEGKLKVDKVKKLRDFAFVHYRNREDAEEALAKLDDTDIDASRIEVTWAKPADKVMRFRSHSRPPQAMPVGPFFYGYDPYTGAIPFANCPGRGGMMPRFPMRGRGRGAAGVKRFRSFNPSPNYPGSFKPPEGGIPNHSTYPYTGNKGGKMSDKAEQYEAGYYLMPLPAHPDGLDSGAAVPGATVLPHSRIPPPGFIYHPLSYEECSYYYIPASQTY